MGCSLDVLCRALFLVCAMSCLFFVRFSFVVIALFFPCVVFVCCFVCVLCIVAIFVLLSALVDCSFLNVFCVLWWLGFFLITLFYSVL